MTRGAVANAASRMADNEKQARLNDANRRLLDESRKSAVQFKEGTYDLEPGQDGEFKRLASEIIDVSRTLNQDFPRLDIVVEGHTENGGSAAHDQSLSDHRAERVCSVLVRYTSMRCNAVGYGNTRPLVSPEDSPAKRAKNRRIVVQVAPRQQ